MKSKQIALLINGSVGFEGFAILYTNYGYENTYAYPFT